MLRQIYSHEADSKKTSKILRHTHQRRDYTPGDGQSRQPELWRSALENDIAG